MRLNPWQIKDLKAHSFNLKGNINFLFTIIHFVILHISDIINLHHKGGKIDEAWIQYSIRAVTKVNNDTQAETGHPVTSIQ
jgi:hypothetical protein